MPVEPGSNVRWIAHASGQAIGAFQPPRKSATNRPETMKTLTYSAKKKKPNRIPEYSVAKPATISLSASVRSNGVRLPSAVAAMKKINAPSGCWKTYQELAPVTCPRDHYCPKEMVCLAGTCEDSIPCNVFGSDCPPVASTTAPASKSPCDVTTRNRPSAGTTSATR